MILLSVVLGIFSTLIAEFLIIRGFDSFWCKRSDYSGTWVQRIYSSEDYECKGKPIKEDLYDLKCFKQNRIFKNRFINGMNINIRGTIIRTKPKKQNRKWRFIGYIAGDIMTILFEPADETAKSRGCIYLKKVRDEEYGNDFFRGFYLEEHSETIDKIPLTLKKKLKTVKRTKKDSVGFIKKVPLILIKKK